MKRNFSFTHTYPRGWSLDGLDTHTHTLQALLCWTCKNKWSNYWLWPTKNQADEAWRTDPCLNFNNSRMLKTQWQKQHVHRDRTANWLKWADCNINVMTNDWNAIRLQRMYPFTYTSRAYRLVLKIIQNALLFLIKQLQTSLGLIPQTPWFTLPTIRPVSIIIQLYNFLDMIHLLLYVQTSLIFCMQPTHSVY